MRKKLLKLLSIVTSLFLAISILPFFDIMVSAVAMQLQAHNLYYTIGEGEKLLDSGFVINYSGNITGGKIYIDQNFSTTDKDKLTCKNSGGISGSYNSSSGIMVLSGTADVASYQNFIRNVSFSTDSGNGTRTILISLTTADGGALYYSGTGHYYEYVDAPGVSWNSAKAAAEAKSHNGNAGYLATITSSEENAFVAAKCAGNGWLGGSDNGHNKIWKWETGPEANQVFCHQNDDGSGYGIGVASTEIYQNFQSAEPNDWSDAGNGYPDGENYLHMYSSSGTWNDYDGNNPDIEGYIVEYGTTFLEVTGSSASIAVTIGPLLYTVSFNSNGGSAVADMTGISKNAKIVTPTAPTKNGFSFGGWFKDAELTDDWDFTNDTVTATTTLFAKWTANAPTIDVVETPAEIKNKDKISVKPVGEAFSKPVEVKLKDDPAVEKAIKDSLNGIIKDELKDTTVFPLDISLYEKGTNTKIQPSEGTSVTITCPIPEKLLANKDKIKVVCLINGKLTVLDTKIIQIDGVWCVQFTATHFSPYAMVVDTANVLATGINNPKTSNQGSPFIPMTLLGLASLTIISATNRKSKKSK